MALVDYASSSDEEEDEKTKVKEEDTEAERRRFLDPPPVSSKTNPPPTHHNRSSERMLSKLTEKSSDESVSSELKLPDASFLLNSPAVPSHLSSSSDHSSRVAAAMAESASRKRELNVPTSSYPRKKVPKGTLPHPKSIPETVGGRLLPPQLAGRSNIVTEDISKLFVRKKADPSSS